MGEESQREIDEREAKIKVIIINENTLNSMITDTYTFTCLIVVLFLNYYLLGNSIVLQIFICLAWCTWLMQKGGKKIKKMTPEEALKYLTKHYPQ